MKNAGLPPRIDATPEEIARAMFRAPRRPVEYREYKCRACGEIVEWPVVLGDDGVCSMSMCAESEDA